MDPLNRTIRLLNLECPKVKTILNKTYEKLKESAVPEYFSNPLEVYVKQEELRHSLRLCSIYYMKDDCTSDNVVDGLDVLFGGLNSFKDLKKLERQMFEELILYNDKNTQYSKTL